MIRLQEAAGLEIVTDGEMRRQSFQSQMTEAIDGFGECTLDAFLWGQWKGDTETDEWGKDRPSNLGVVSKLARRRYLSVDEFVFLKSHTRQTPKITLPSPSLFANFWSFEHSKHAYPTLDSFLPDVVDILRGEVAELIRHGATYIQLDAPHYCLLLDPKTRAFYEAQSWNIEIWLNRGIEMDNAVMGNNPEVTFGFHL
jgi:5-methyltetrahydropteroyltriglutamate--homocysteine methyltransferase